MAYFKYKDKSVFYEEYGQGEPSIFLHGNTASSKMSELLMPLYAENFRCILIDFLGNGQSDRVEKFSPDMWHDEALQTIALTEHLQCGKVSLVGTSGGAWAAVNAALERPDLFHAVIADSFDGRTLNENFSANLLTERKAAKHFRSRPCYDDFKMPGSKGLNPHELAHKWVKDLGTRPDMSIKVGWISHDMRILGRIVRVRSTEQSVGIMVGGF